MVAPDIKRMLYENGITISDISRIVGLSPRAASLAIERWHGRTGNPRGKTREVLKEVERHIGQAIYTEAA